MFASDPDQEKKGNSVDFRPAAAAILCLAMHGAASAFAGQSAVVLTYHRFGEDTLPSTNIRLDQFDAHVRELSTGKYTVMALPDIVAAIREGRDLPDRAVAITIDDAYLSVHARAWPRLRKAGLPFTVFVSTDPVDKRYRALMNWDQIRELARAGVTIGNHTASHLHMAGASPERNAAEIAASNARFKKQLGFIPRIFAYPYGEFSLAVRRLVKDAGFIAAFGQHSGAIFRGTDRYYLPRFAMNEAYGEFDRFKLAVNTLPLPVRDLAPADPLLANGGNPPQISFTVVGDARRGLGSLACYASGRGKIKHRRMGDGRIKIHLTRAFSAGRTRVNCTMPVGQGRWRWFGLQFYVPGGVVKSR